MIRRTTALLAALVAGGLISVGQADDEDRITIKPEAKRIRPATSIDFNYDLGLSFDSLKTLGKQIEDCRQVADPVGLAAASKLLEAAEHAAGGDKECPLTSEQLQKEAVELAKRRAVPSELEALAKLLGNDDLHALAEAAAENDEKARLAAESGDVTRDLDGDLHVINHSHEGFWIYANGYYIGYVGPHGQLHRHLHGVHYLDARNHYHHLHRHIHGHHHHYDFYIHVHH